MEQTYGHLLAWFSLLFLAGLIWLLKQRKSRNSGNQRPPGPKPWPIFRNIFDLGTIPHHALYKLRFQYGPVIRVRLGFVNTLVIQSAKAVEELFKNHDVNFCDRKVPECFTAHNYNQIAVSLGQYGSKWRFHRRLVTVELMTIKRINDFTIIRQNCVENMKKYIEDDVAAAIAGGKSGEVVVAHYVFVMAFNLIGNLVISQDLLNSHSKEGHKFFDAMEKVMQLGAMPNVADLLPFLKGLDLQRMKKRMEKELGQAIM